MWKGGLNWILGFFNPTYMSKKSQDEIIFYSTSTGRVFVKEDEFLRTDRVKKMIQKLLASRLYRDIKEQESKFVANR
jgi:hypothetical protein